MESTKKILIVAGEASGDLHAANLIKAIKQISPSIQFFGLGGKKLKEQGVDLYCDIVELAVVGFFEVIKNLGKFQRIFKGLLEKTDLQKPDLAILVDYPGFNLRLAVELKKRNIPVIYYISPQIWAWGGERIKLIKRVVNLMLVVFRFEEELYKKNNMAVEFIGHPILDNINPGSSKERILTKLGLDKNNLIFTILPGSREKEVKTLLPIMLETAKLVNKEIPNTKFLILRSSTVKKEIFDSIIAHCKLPVHIISDMTHDGLMISDFAMVASGTATLETAIFTVPMVILYKVSFLTWAYMKMLIKIPYIGLVNVVKQDKFIKEFIQYDINPRKIAEYIVKTLRDKQEMNRIKEGLIQVKNSLGEQGASQKAAKIIVDFLMR